MNWTVNIAGSARGAIKRFPTKDQERILRALREMMSNPYFGDIEKIDGEVNTWRRRVGNYRMIYDIDASNRLVEVRIVKRRTSSTY